MTHVVFSVEFKGGRAPSVTDLTAAIVRGLGVPRNHATLIVTKITPESQKTDPYIQMEGGHFGG